MPLTKLTPSQSLQSSIQSNFTCPKLNSRSFLSNFLFPVGSPSQHTAIPCFQFLRQNSLKTSLSPFFLSDPTSESSANPIGSTYKIFPESCRSGVAQLAEHHTAKPKVASLIPGQGTCLGYRFGPSWSEGEKQLISFFLSPSLPMSLKNKLIKCFKKIPNHFFHPTLTSLVSAAIISVSGDWMSPTWTPSFSPFLVATFTTQQPQGFSKCESDQIKLPLSSISSNSSPPHSG